MWRARRVVARVRHHGIEVSTGGDKTLLGIRIPAAALRTAHEPGGRAKLEDDVREAVLRGRVAADYEAAGVFSELIGMAAILADMPELPEDKEPDPRFMVVPELVAAVRELMRERGWTRADLAARAELVEKLLADLLVGRYSPFEAMRGRKHLNGVIDLAAPLARAFDLTPEELWRRGRRRVDAFERAKRRQIKKVVKGLRGRRGRRRDAERASRAALALGKLAGAGLISETELDLIIREENLVEMLRSGRDWLAWRHKDKIDNEELGLLLGPNGEVLHEAITRTELDRLFALDSRAVTDPESVTAEEVEWARKLLGLPALEWRGRRFGPAR
jgi:transcriptional regulator with XRE-family HTH domain